MVLIDSILVEKVFGLLLGHVAADRDVDEFIERLETELPERFSVYSGEDELELVMDKCCDPEMPGEDLYLACYRDQLGRRWELLLAGWNGYTEDESLLETLEERGLVLDLWNPDEDESVTLLEIHL